MAKGLYRMRNGQVLVEYDKRRRVPIPSAQYKANGYKPPCDKLPPEVPRKARKELAMLRPEGCRHRCPGAHHLPCSPASKIHVRSANAT